MIPACEQVCLPVRHREFNLPQNTRDPPRRMLPSLAHFRLLPCQFVSAHLVRILPGTPKDTQGMLRHASIKTAGDVSVQTIEQSVVAAVNSRTSAVLGNWKMPDADLGLKGRNLKGPNAIRRSLAKPDGEEVVSY